MNRINYVYIFSNFVLKMVNQIGCHQRGFIKLQFHSLGQVDYLKQFVRKYDCIFSQLFDDKWLATCQQNQ